MDFIAYASGALAALAFLGMATSWRWHCWAHDRRYGTFLLGHLWCGYCAREALEITREQGHDMDKFERMLDNE